MELPLFPLPLVLYPGSRQLLHLFEPRYRQLLVDCLAADMRFGLSVMRRPEGRPEADDVGCRALIQSHQRFPDGKANILVVGEERFLIDEVLDGEAPYYVGRVRLFQDRPEDDEALDALAEEVWRLYAGIREALLPGDPEAAEPSPDDPGLISFHVAAAIDLELEVKEGLLRMTSARERLERLASILPPWRRQMEERIEMRHRAKGNGRKTPPSEADP